MIKSSILRVRAVKLWIAAAPLMLISGCGLTDQDLAGIIQTSLTAALSSWLSQALQSLIPAAA